MGGNLMRLFDRAYPAFECKLYGDAAEPQRLGILEVSNPTPYEALNCFIWINTNNMYIKPLAHFMGTLTTQKFTHSFVLPEHIIKKSAGKVSVLDVLDEFDFLIKYTTDDSRTRYFRRRKGKEYYTITKPTDFIYEGQLKFNR